jgi:hypothetical protein
MMFTIDGECYDTSLVSCFLFLLFCEVFIETLMIITVSNSNTNGQERER